MILADAREFMAAESWYSQRALPYRRGYLFHGCPGSGKTSLVHALAGALGLNIYVINLNKKGIDDSVLSELVSTIPSRSIALIEEIDAIFHRGVSREDHQAAVVAAGESAGVTLSGLLSSIDGIHASEGRLLIATTNEYHALDPALIRPGRMDLHIEFTYSSKAQAETLFKRFFPVAVNDDDISQEKPVATRSDEDEDEDALLPELLSRTQRDKLAAQFGEAVPDREFAMADLQGLLMRFKSDPSGAVSEAPRWVEKERKDRKEKQKKEAEEKAKEKEREEKEKEKEAKKEAEEAGKKAKEVEVKDKKVEELGDLPAKITKTAKTNGIDHSSDSA
jgi:chaperone BCS1